jgi:Icc-related predicted phosphoesterase
MKVLAVADIVREELLEISGGSPLFTDIDCIISCGDLPPEYLTSLKARYDIPLLYVQGNHDLRYESSPPVGCTPIDRRLIVYGEIRITGFSGSRWYNGNENQFTEREMSSFIRKLKFTLWRKRGVDWVITHAPPRFINDEEDRCHRGFRIYRTFIEKYKPSLFLHGHIHKLFDNDDQRITHFHNTKVINCYGYYTFTFQTDGLF